MVFRSFVKQIWSGQAGNLVSQSKRQNHPILASFTNQKYGKDLIENQGCKTWMQWIVGPRFTLIILCYMYWSKPWIHTRKTAARTPYAILKKVKKSVKLKSPLQHNSKPKKDSNTLPESPGTCFHQEQALTRKESKNTSPTVWIYFQICIS